MQFTISTGLLTTLSVKYLQREFHRKDAKSRKENNLQVLLSGSGGVTQGRARRQRLPDREIPQMLFDLNS